MEKLLLIYAFTLLGCGPEGQMHRIAIDPDLAPYYQGFVFEAEKQQVNLNVRDLVLEFIGRFTDPSTLGLCRYGLVPTVNISREKWGYMNDLDREQVVYHELGHCILGRGHIHEIVVDNGEYIFKSLMDPFLFNYRMYQDHHVYYMHELFHPQ